MGSDCVVAVVTRCSLTLHCGGPALVVEWPLGRFDSFPRRAYTMGYLHLGQYRKVEGGYDGDSVYQCLWCKNTVRICDDPAYWNFCPKCGKSWFKRMRCRLAWVPRWFWDKYGTNDRDAKYPMYSQKKAPTSQWVLWSRHRWEGEEWGDWEVDHKYDKDPYNPDWKWALQLVRGSRWDQQVGAIEVEYKMTLEKKDA